MWRTRRKQPYTAEGIKRLRCIRCAQPARFQWQVCADGNNFRPLCLACDVALNLMVLKWAGDPDASRKVAAYQQAK